MLKTGLSAGIIIGISYTVGNALMPVFDALTTKHAVLVQNLILSLSFVILFQVNNFINDKKNKNIENKMDEVLKIVSFDTGSIHTANKILESKK